LGPEQLSKIEIEQKLRSQERGQTDARELCYSNGGSDIIQHVDIQSKCSKLALTLQFFLPARRYASAVFATATCLSVRPSVRLSHAGIVPIAERKQDRAMYTI